MRDRFYTADQYADELQQINAALVDIEQQRQPLRERKAVLSNYFRTQKKRGYMTDEEYNTIVHGGIEK